VNTHPNLTRPALSFCLWLASGCTSPDDPDLAGSLAELDGAEAYGLGWVKADDGASDGSVVIRVSTWIDAPVDTVWELVREPNGYASFNMALTASAPRVEVGQPIALDIRLFGDALPPTRSDEIIEILDHELHVASWYRDFGFGQETRRPQLLEAEGGGTRYYTALRLPGSLAWVVAPLLGEHIRAAFTRFAQGLETAAEQG
jgi:hypothetical protein